MSGRNSGLAQAIAYQNIDIGIGIGIATVEALASVSSDPALAEGVSTQFDQLHATERAGRDAVIT